MTAGVRAALAAVLREARADARLDITSMHPVGGGCISPAARIETPAGRFFAKWNDAGPPDLFLREADGLRAMADATSGLAIPRVVAARGPEAGAPALIVMEFLDPGPLDDEALGVGLAQMHRGSAPAFGFEADTYCGLTRQDNTNTPSWTEFYARRRLAPLVARIDTAHGLSAADRRVYERLIDRLPALLPEPERPSLIHGDLWSGNVLGARRGPALVDPACAFADREMELGMMTLFGGFSDRTFDAYDDTWPLPPGWRQRNGLFQLYHLLNHFLLFGGHYGPQALAMARRYA